MNVNIQTVHFDADGKLRYHIERKIEKFAIMGKNFEKIKNIIQSFRDMSDINKKSNTLL